MGDITPVNVSLKILHQWSLSTLNTRTNSCGLCWHVKSEIRM